MDKINAPIMASDVTAVVTDDGLSAVLSVMDGQKVQLVMVDRLVLERLVHQASSELELKPKRARLRPTE